MVLIERMLPHRQVLNIGPEGTRLTHLHRLERVKVVPPPEVKIRRFPVTYVIESLTHNTAMINTTEFFMPVKGRCRRRRKPPSSVHSVQRPLPPLPRELFIRMLPIWVSVRLSVRFVKSVSDTREVRHYIKLFNSK